MKKLNDNAANIASRYIVSNNISNDINKPKRGLQAEINKIDSIQRVITTKHIDNSELLRLKLSLNILISSIDYKLEK